MRLLEYTVARLAERLRRAQPHRGSSCSPSAHFLATVRSRSYIRDGGGTAVRPRRPFPPGVGGQLDVTPSAASLIRQHYDVAADGSAPAT